MDTDHHAAGQDSDAYTVQLMTPEQAGEVVNLFRTVYGDAYPIKLFYDPDELIQANRDGSNYTVVSCGTDGAVVSTVNMYPSAPNKSIYEIGSGLASPEHRGKGLSELQGRKVCEELVPDLGFDLLFGESVCNHVYSQKLCIHQALVDCALEAALMPADVYSKEKASVGRVATVLSFRTYRPRPHPVYVPKAYAEELEFIYAGLDDERERVAGHGALLPTGSSRLDVQMFEFAQVARLAFWEVAADFPMLVDHLDQEFRGQGVLVMQVSVSLAQPCIDEVVHELQSRGYFFGGVLPRWFDDDGLLMEKLFCEPEFEHIQLLSDRAKDILEMVKRDWLRATTRDQGPALA
jgi:hypothetical protein